MSAHAGARRRRRSALATRRSSRRSNDELRATRRSASSASRRRSSKWSCARPPRRARFQPGQFYRLQNFEALAPRARRHAPRDGRPRAHRRVGRSRARAGLDDRARDGRLVAICARCCSPGEPVVLMGPTGTPTEIASATRPSCWSAAASATRCCSRSARRCARAGSRVLYFAGYKKMIDRYKVDGDRSGGRRGRLVLRRGARLHADARRRTAHSSATSSGDGARTQRRAGRAADRASRRRPHHRDRLGPDDGRGRRGAPRRAGAVPEAAITSRIGSINSPMQCMMKEICAQCLQPHRDPGDRQDDATSSRASTRTSRSTQVDFPALDARLRAERACRRS